MPELAEVEYFRQQWNAGIGRKVSAIEVHANARIFRECPAEILVNGLAGATLRGSDAQAKQMLFEFSGGRWLGLHLGMTGRLLSEPKQYAAGPWDHFMLRQASGTLVFRDPRQFGLLKWHVGKTPPDWWVSLPPAILSEAFTVEAMAAFLKRRGKSPLKAVLLMQERFPGVGNWMADEILWRANLHPQTKAGALTNAEQITLHCKVCEVCADALRAIAGQGGALPPDLNVNIPESWLFWHRWRDGGHCPRDGQALQRESIGGRTSCWCPQCQNG
ncbi:Fpg/Nei family DNA glycosylase [Cerasicoccus arenae]|uniref:Formamidopyrimidine-DNA glycosylase n=1 Tax=Cerasicoccus arenae TaxID=424488 RepID=A0A8J3GDH5_9BACT|nr:Fpg/Nei family DNA glycosylase [Cerasicoccus arenae]MBK1857553.1 Fpg/Nei family DNA glycosylase [Cerasicoccus arenae]GHB95700.1 formamidopyrimidine-DNA glycosylase [Cerasicoccus arenae]